MRGCDGVTCPMLSVGMGPALAPSTCHGPGEFPSPSEETKLCMRDGCGARRPKPGGWIHSSGCCSKSGTMRCTVQGLTEMR